jgi:hypothetical protein
MSVTGINPAGSNTPIGASNVTPVPVYLTLIDGAGVVFEFSGFEIPEVLPFGGEQALGIQKLLGGARVIDAMGADDAPLSWSGRFRGPSASSRATYLDAKRRAGRPMTLAWADFNYTVFIQSFVADYQRDWEIPYRISCVVVQDNRNPNTTLQQPTVDQMVNEDLQGAMGYADDCPLGTLSSVITPVQTAIGSLQSAISVAGPLLNNVPGLNSVNAALGLAQVATGTALTAINTGLSFYSTLGGQIPGASILTNIAAMTASTTLMAQLACMQATSAYLVRMGVNIAGAVGAFS